MARRGAAPDFDAGGRRIAWFFALIAAGCVAAAGWAAVDAAGLAGTGQAATGRVVALRTEERRLQPGEAGYTRGAVRRWEVPEVEFRTRDGRVVRVRGAPAADDGKPWAVGDTLALRYLPSDPAVVEFEAGDGWFVVGLFAVFGIAFALPLLFMVVLPALRPKRRG